MNELRIEIDELKIILDILSKSEVCDSSIRLTGGYTLKLDDEQAHHLSEEIKKSFVFKGFDKMYKLNNDGELLQKLIDKFISLGW